MSPEAGASVPPHRILKAKACLVGARGVGKTSLLRRFVLDTFDDRYLTTIGTKVSKREILVHDPESGTDWAVDLTVWDIMGERGFRVLLQEAYFFGAQGLLAVADVTRRDTFTDLDDWVEAATGACGRVPVVLAANKEDLPRDPRRLGGEAEAAAERLGAVLFPTSAKTGFHVVDCFEALAGQVVARHVASREAVTGRAR